MAEWLAPRGVDILCLQEVRAPDAVVQEFLGEDWHVLHAEAEAKGRAGVAIASRRGLEPVATASGIGDDYFATAGRWVEADFVLSGGAGTDRTLTVVSAYVHSGEVGHPQAGGQVPLPGRDERAAARAAPGTATTPWWWAT